MAFSAILNNDPSKIFAVTKEISQLLQIPAEKINPWLKAYPKIEQPFLQTVRYAELIETINELLFNRPDQRIYGYLLGMSLVKSNKMVRAKHRHTKQNLGASREVITRTIRKLEKENKVRKLKKGSKLFPKIKIGVIKVTCLR